MDDVIRKLKRTLEKRERFSEQRGKSTVLIYGGGSSIPSKDDEPKFILGNSSYGALCWVLPRR